MVIRVSPKCKYGTFTLRKVTIVREMTNFFKFFSFLADWQSKQQNHARISLSSDLRSETRNQIALSCYSEGQIHESWENRWLDVWYILWIGGGYSKNNCTIQTIHAFTCWVLDSVRVYTVQPLLTATSLQQSLFWSRPTGSPHIHSCLNLSTSATSLQRLRPLKRGPSCPKKHLDNSQYNEYSQLPMKKSKMVMEFYSYGTLMINRGIGILIVLNLYCCSKYKLSTILIANVVNLARFVSFNFWFKTLFKFFFYFISIYNIIYDGVK